MGYSVNYEAIIQEFASHWSFYNLNILKCLKHIFWSDIVKLENYKPVKVYFYPH